MKKSLIVLLILIILAILSMSCIPSFNKIAVISLDGTIQSSSGASFLGGSSITPDEVRTLLKKATDDATVRAVVIRLNTPGGDPAACQEIVYEMDRLDKPLVISMRSMATSGGYYISAKADKIVALSSTLTGSIGVITQIPDINGLFEKIGIKMEILKSGKYKDMYAGMRPLTEEEKGLIQENTDQIYGQFVDVIVEGRHMERQKVLELADGRVYTGIEARQLGLVDEIGDVHTAIDLAAELAGIKSPQVEYYKQETSDFLKLLLGMNPGQLDKLLGAGLIGAEGVAALDIINNPYPVYLYR